MVWGCSNVLRCLDFPSITLELTTLSCQRPLFRKHKVKEWKMRCGTIGAVRNMPHHSMQESQACSRKRMRHAPPESSQMMQVDTVTAQSERQCGVAMVASDRSASSQAPARRRPVKRSFFDGVTATDSEAMEGDDDVDVLMASAALHDDGSQANVSRKRARQQQPVTHFISLRVGRAAFIVLTLDRSLVTHWWQV